MQSITQVELTTIAKRPDVIEQVADWWLDEFGYMNPGRTLAQNIDRLHLNYQTDQMPVCYLYLVNGELVGTASLREYDLDDYKLVSPWLGSVIVHKQQRGKGLGSQLVNLVMREAFLRREKPWYLCTPDRQSFYARLGWQAIDKATHNGIPVVIMRLLPKDFKLEE